MPEEKRLNLTIDEVVSHLQKVEHDVKRSEVDALINEIESAKKIFVYGAGRSGYVARAFAQRLMQTGSQAFFVGETSTPAGGKGDLLIIVTGSGTTPSVITTVETAKKLGLRVFAVSSNREGAAQKGSDNILVVPGKTKLLERQSYAPFTSLFDIASLTVLDGITAELMLLRGLTDKNIGTTHANLE
jgi:6-phospho 3-hexuloisomerase